MSEKHEIEKTLKSLHKREESFNRALRSQNSFVKLDEERKYKVDYLDLPALPEIDIDKILDLIK